MQKEKAKAAPKPVSKPIDVPDDPQDRMVTLATKLEDVKARRKALEKEGELGASLRLIGQEVRLSTELRFAEKAHDFRVETERDKAKKLGELAEKRRGEQIERLYDEASSAGARAEAIKAIPSYVALAGDKLDAAQKNELQAALTGLADRKEPASDEQMRMAVKDFITSRKADTPQPTFDERMAKAMQDAEIRANATVRELDVESAKRKEKGLPPKKGAGATEPRIISEVKPGSVRKALDGAIKDIAAASDEENYQPSLEEAMGNLSAEQLLAGVFAGDLPMDARPKMLKAAAERIAREAGGAPSIPTSGISASRQALAAAAIRVVSALPREFQDPAADLLMQELGLLNAR